MDIATAIQALAEETASKHINKAAFNGWNNMPPLLKEAIIEAMMEMYRAGWQDAKADGRKGMVNNHNQINH